MIYPLRNSSDLKERVHFVKRFIVEPKNTRNRIPEETYLTSISIYLSRKGALCPEKLKFMKIRKRQCKFLCFLKKKKKKYFFP